MFELCRCWVANFTSCSEFMSESETVAKNRIEFQWGSKLQGTSSEALGGWWMTTTFFCLIICLLYLCNEALLAAPGMMQPLKEKCSELSPYQLQSFHSLAWQIQLFYKVSLFLITSISCWGIWMNRDGGKYIKATIWKTNSLKGLSESWYNTLKWIFFVIFFSFKLLPSLINTFIRLHSNWFGRKINGTCYEHIINLEKMITYHAKQLQKLITVFFYSMYQNNIDYLHAIFWSHSIFFKLKTTTKVMEKEWSMVNYKHHA